MRKGIKEIKRKLGRVAEELTASCRVGAKTSIVDGFHTFKAKLKLHTIVNETPADREMLLHKHRSITTYLEKAYGTFWATYTLPLHLATDDHSKNPYPDKIWVCWWQGLDNAPELVKACVESIRRHAGSREVILITDDNLHQFVTFPSHITALVKSGAITRTHLSDLLRFSLLSRYGGMWLDATFFATGDLTQWASLPLWTIKRPDYGHLSPACGRFANYSIACDYEHRYVFDAPLQFLYHYWLSNRHLVDYLLVDYATSLSIIHEPTVARLYEAIPPNNPQCDDLVKHLGQPFDPTEWDRLCSDTQLFKLTWKAQFPLRVHGRPTFLEHILSKPIE